MIGIDRDPEAIKAFMNLKNIDFERISLIHSKFSNISKILTNWTNVKGIIFDLGYSTAQVKIKLNSVFTF